MKPSRIKLTKALTSLAAAIDKELWKRGFARGPVRNVARWSILVSLAVFLSGILLFPLTKLVFWFGVGAILSCWNFLSMARYVLYNFPLISGQARSRTQFLGGQLGRWFFRLFMTVFLVYMALVHFEANPFALLGGLGLTVFCIPVLFFVAENN